MTLAHCHRCNAWLAPDESCLHIRAVTPCAELPTAGADPFGIASCVSAVGLSHRQPDSREEQHNHG
jgi:hypothetical protein